MNDAFEKFKSFCVQLELFRIDLLGNCKVDVVLFPFKEIIEIQFI